MNEEHALKSYASSQFAFAGEALELGDPIAALGLLRGLKALADEKGGADKLGLDPNLFRKTSTLAQAGSIQKYLGRAFELSVMGINDGSVLALHEAEELAKPYGGLEKVVRNPAALQSLRNLVIDG